jgi:hypothetical protein
MNLNITPTGVVVLILTFLYLVLIVMDLSLHFMGLEPYISISQIVLCVIIILAVFTLFKRKL